MWIRTLARQQRWRLLALSLTVVAVLSLVVWWLFQEWKEDVSWAKAGQVTAALGGDIAKEARALPSPEALKPQPPPDPKTPQARYILYFYFAPEGCSHCERMASVVERFYTLYAGAPRLQLDLRVEVIAVPISSWGTEVGEFKRQTGLTATVGPDPGLQVSRGEHPVVVLYNRESQRYFVLTVGAVSYASLAAQFERVATGREPLPALRGLT